MRGEFDDIAPPAAFCARPRRYNGHGLRPLQQLQCLCRTMVGANFDLYCSAVDSVDTQYE